MKKLIKSPITWSIIAALLVAVPQITSYQFLATDLVQVGTLEGLTSYPGFGPLTLYRIADGTAGHLAGIIADGPMPWYANPNFKLNFCRHIPSLLIALNHKISGLNPAGYYIHSVLWFILLILLLGLLVQEIVPAAPRRESGGKSGFAHPAAYLAMIMYAFSTVHLEVIFYSSARWTFIAAAFGLAGLLAHIKWREGNWKAGRYLSLIAFLLALLSGEGTFAVLAYLAAYELFGAAGHLKEKIKALLPAAILVFIYLLFYKIMDYGADGNGYYTNPLTEPIVFIINLPVKLAAILGEMVFGVLSLFWLDQTDPFQHMLTIIAGASALVICGLLFYPAWVEAAAEQRRRLKWLTVGTIASMFPMASASPGGRIAVVPFIGGSILLAFILHYWLKKLRKNLKSPAAWIGGLICTGLFLLHMIMSPYAWFAGAGELRQYHKSQDDFNKETVLNEIQPHQKAIFLAGTPESMLFYQYYQRKINRLPMPGSWWELSFSNHKHHYLRTAENKLELEISGEKVWDFFDGWGLRRHKPPLKKGSVIRLSGLLVTILVVEKDVPVRMEFTFDYSLDDERYYFFNVKENRLHNLSPPPVGQAFK